MKITQVNNSQPNFGNFGIIAKKGAAKLLVGPQNPELLAMATKGMIRDDLPGLDYFLFGPGQQDLETRVSNHLNMKLGMLVANVGNRLPHPNEAPLTMETLIGFGNITGV